MAAQDRRPRRLASARCLAVMASAVLSVAHAAVVPATLGARTAAPRVFSRNLHLRGGSAPPPAGNSSAPDKTPAPQKKDAETPGTTAEATPKSPFNPMIQRMDSSMNMQPRSFMAQTVTRSESYSALDQMATTETLREKAETTYESKPVNLAGLSGKNAPQPAPKYDKGIAEAWLKAAEEAVSKISGEKRAKAAAEKAAAQQREEEAKKKAAAMGVVAATTTAEVAAVMMIGEALLGAVEVAAVVVCATHGKRASVRAETAAGFSTAKHAVHHDHLRFVSGFSQRASETH